MPQTTSLQNSESAACWSALASFRAIASDRWATAVFASGGPSFFSVRHRRSEFALGKGCEVFGIAALICPVASLATMMAAPITSAGPFSFPESAGCSARRTFPSAQGGMPGFQLPTTPASASTHETRNQPVIACHNEDSSRCPSRQTAPDIRSSSFTRKNLPTQSKDACVFVNSARRPSNFMNGLALAPRTI